MTGLRMITVCVDYADVLAITLPRNVHHFAEVHVVTDHKSHPDVIKTLLAVVTPNLPRTPIAVHVTDLFYADGAAFNKWRALEWGLDQMGRHGWLCVMDADVIWPRVIPPVELKVGQLMTPYRRMWDEWPKEPSGGWGKVSPGAVLDEALWSWLPRHPNVREWAGYTQIFHATDPALGQPPWHETDWRHAGGADSFFQAKWPKDRKVRPVWEVLHLGPAGVNWIGRASRRADGTEPAEAEARKLALFGPDGLWAMRREARAAGRDQFRPERLPPRNPTDS